MKKASCEIFGRVAREAPRVVLFRHGPSGHNQLILWLTDRDEFIRGQWLKARLCPSMDLSPNGSLLVYSAKRYGRPERQWTAISRPPYFTALVAWEVDVQPGSGGWFDSNDVVRLTGVRPDSPILTGYVPASLRVQYVQWCGSFAEQAAEFEQRASWRIHPAKFRKWDKEPTTVQFETPIQTRGNLVPDYAPLSWLRLPYEPLTEPVRARNAEAVRSAYLVKQGRDFEVRLPSGLSNSPSLILAHDLSRTQYLLRGIDWANVDQSGRVVFTRGGVVHVCHANSRGEPVVTALADFSADRFEAISPPDSAMRW